VHALLNQTVFGSGVTLTLHTYRRTAAVVTDMYSTVCSCTQAAHAKDVQAVVNPQQRSNSTVTLSVADEDSITSNATTSSDSTVMPTQAPAVQVISTLQTYKHALHTIVRCALNHQHVVCPMLYIQFLSLKSLYIVHMKLTSSLHLAVLAVFATLQGSSSSSDAPQSDSPRSDVPQAHTHISHHCIVRSP
jgi:hypothetical protein